ncbi:MAG: glycosyltransferase N-terminal domain-containing protein, partial [Gemmatimonadota bacterium]
MLVYRAALFGLRLLSPVLSIGESKLARGVAGRRHAHELLVAWGSTLRDPDRPLVWFHAPSVGEGLRADAVIRALRGLDPDVQIVFTFFSPSAEEWARSFDADVATYLPWDLGGPMRAALDALRPDLVAFTKTEVWPVLAELCGERDIPTALIGASVPPDAGRRKKGARALLGPAWQGMHLAAAIGERDVDGLLSLGVEEPRVVTTGDPGIDAAVARFEERDVREPAVELLRSSRPTWIAGSTWPSDERVILPAFERVRARVVDARLLVVPHEPTPDRAANTLAGAKARGWSIGLLSEIATSGVGRDSDVIVVDRVGLL